MGHDIDCAIDVEDLRRTLQSLACGKKKVLKKVPPGRDVNNSDVFKFNIDFEDPHPKIHINSIQAKVSVRKCFLFVSSLTVCVIVCSIPA